VIVDYCGVFTDASTGYADIGAGLTFAPGERR